MNRIDIVGLGPGSPDYLLPEALTIINRSDVLIGGQRALASVDPGCKKVYQLEYPLEGVLDIIDRHREEKICVIASGDPAFYGILKYFKKWFPEDRLRVTPGITSFQYLSARCGLVWENAGFVSLHGREADIIQAVRQHPLVFFLTDEKHSPASIVEILKNNGFQNRMIYIGNRLSYPDELIVKVRVCDFIPEKYRFEFSITAVNDE